MIELKGSLKEKLDKIISLIPEAEEEQLNKFRNFCQQFNLPLLKSAEDFYKKYGNIKISVILENPSNAFCFDFHCDIKFSYGIKQKLYWQESVNERMQEMAEFAKQKVCPIAEIGYYYPPEVFVGMGYFIAYMNIKRK